MTPQHGPLPDSAFPTTHVPLYTFYPPPRRSSLTPLPPALRPPFPASPTSPRFQTPPQTPTFASSRPDSFRAYSPQLSPSYAESPRWSSRTLKAPYIREESRSPTPSTPYSVNSTDPLPLTPTGTHLSLTSTAGRNSTTPMFKVPRGVSIYAERSTWEKDEDDGSQKGKTFATKTVELKHRRWWLVGLGILLVLVIVALGTGLGIGLRKKHRNEKESHSSSSQLDSSNISILDVAVSTTATSQQMSETILPSIISPPTLTSTSTISKTSLTSNTPSTSSVTYTNIQTTLPKSNSAESYLRSSLTSVIYTTTTFSSPSPTPKCPSPSACNEPFCEGRNRIGMLGWCTAGPHSGCGCVSICGSELGQCNSEFCGGSNGVCEFGEWAGCPCE